MAGMGGSHRSLLVAGSNGEDEGVAAMRDGHRQLRRTADEWTAEVAAEVAVEVAVGERVGERVKGRVEGRVEGVQGGAQVTVTYGDRVSTLSSGRKEAGRPWSF